MDISNLTEHCGKTVKESTISEHLLECVCWTDFDHLNTLTSDTIKLDHLLKKACLSNMRNQF